MTCFSTASFLRFSEPSQSRVPRPSDPRQMRESMRIPQHIPGRMWNGTDWQPECGLLFAQRPLPRSAPVVGKSGQLVRLRDKPTDVR